MYLDPFLNPPYERNEINERSLKTELALVCELTRTSCNFEYASREISRMEKGERDGLLSTGLRSPRRVRIANFAPRGVQRDDLRSRAMTADGERDRCGRKAAVLALGTPAPCVDLF
jgi:hypothetical protein